MKRLFVGLLLLGCLQFFSAAMAETPKRTHHFAVGKGTFLMDGKPFVIKAAELHYPRIPRPYWEHRIKMCKALGMNTICLYVFWNIHEQKPGEFDFTGQNDVAEFCRLAQKHDMFVIVRPGPYVCAEWDMGGLPWWLLKKKDIRLRTLDPYFMERVALFEKAVAHELAPLTIEKGGPIIMVQVENEYGAYAADKPYVSAIRDTLRSVGFDKVTLFQCDWSSTFEANGLDDMLWTMNFGTGANIDEQCRRLGEVRPDQPKMCSEFWSGWFDKWGSNHETRPAEQMVEGISQMLSRGISFSLYMTHGGTSFGHWAGGNSPGLWPDVTSYDYDAPINEYGLATPKYYLLRDTLQHYAETKLPAVPKAPMPIIAIPEVELTEHVPLEAGIDTTLVSKTPLTFEELDMGWGTVLYSTTLPDIPAGAVLHAPAHDYAIVCLDGRPVGTLDRTKQLETLTLPAAKVGTRLTLILEGMGRINFGWGIHDFKGLAGKATITSEDGNALFTIEPKQWEMSTLPDTYENCTRAFTRKVESKLQTKAGYYRGFFHLKRVGDTFLHTEAFGKGLVYVNGYAIGRIWHKGPQQTLYVPGCWLKKGKNEVIVMDVTGPKGRPVVSGLTSPIWDKLNPEMDVTATFERPDLTGKKACLEAVTKEGNGWQSFRAATAATGRHCVLRIEGVHADAAEAAIAEIYLLDSQGKRLSRDSWKAVYADSESGNHTTDKLFDLQESTFWQSKPQAKKPLLLVIDLGSEQTVTGLDYLPRAEKGAPGSVSRLSVFVY